MARGRDDSAARKTARRIGTWRRLVLSRGPANAVHVAMIVAEHAHADDQALVARPTHEALAAITRCGLRTVERRIAELVSSGWLQRIGPRARTGTAQTYRLVSPREIDAAAIEAAYSLAPGMWARLTGKLPVTDGGHEPVTDGGQSGATARHAVHDSPSNGARQPVTDGGPTGINRINRTRVRARVGAARAAPEQSSSTAPEHVSTTLARIRATLDGAKR